LKPFAFGEKSPQTKRPAPVNVPYQFPGGDVPNMAEGGLPDLRMPYSFPDHLSVPNLAGGFDPNANSFASPQQPHGAQAAYDSDWKGSMQSATNGLIADDRQLGYEPNVGSSQLAGGRGTDFVNGSSTEQSWDTPPQNFAKGGMVAAVQREKKAIARGTGGAPKSAKPEPVMLGGKPAVVNSSEAIVPTPEGDAVLNPDQQQEVANMAGGSLIKPSHKGRLHRALGIPEGQKIPAKRIAEAKHSSDPHMRKMANFAANFGKPKLKPFVFN
jgi:hypothetical protein